MHRRPLCALLERRAGNRTAHAEASRPKAEDRGESALVARDRRGTPACAWTARWATEGYLFGALALAVPLVACSSDPEGGAPGPDSGVLDVSFDAVADTTPSGVDSVASPDTSTGDAGALPTTCDGLADGAGCDDGDACTQGTTCLGGVCQGGAATSCKSASPCRTSTCDPAVGCVEEAVANGTTCDLACFESATCKGGLCDGDVPLTCPASQAPCVRALTCDPASGLCSVPELEAPGTPCDADGDVCTTDTCSDAGVCTATGAVDTCQSEAQSAPCQAWLCDAADGCVVTGVVPDGVACGSLRVCDDGQCVEDGCQSGCGTPLPCPTLTAGIAAPDDIRSGPVAIVGGASIHLLGGSPSTQHLVYSPGSGWIEGTALEDGVREGAGALIGTRWYLVDGDENEGVRIYDLMAGQWSLGAERPAAPPRGPAAGTDGTYLFVAGGADDSINGTSATHRYDPGADSWTTVAPMPTPRGFVAHAVVGDRLYVFGGRDKALSGSTIVDAAEAYDMATDTWHVLEDMPTKRNSAFAAAVGDHIVVAGGFGGSTQTDVIEIYDTVNDTWQACSTTMGNAFSGGAAATLNGVLYLFGGGSDETGVEIGTF